MKDEIISIFNNYPEEVIIGTGITKENIVRLEEILDVQLPRSYKDYLGTFGYGGIFGSYIFGIENPPNSGTVIDNTKKWLNEGMPQGFVVIEDVDEFLYCLNTNEINNLYECPVVVYFPFGNKPYYRTRYSSFEEYLEDGIQDGLDNLD